MVNADSSLSSGITMAVFTKSYAGESSNSPREFSIREKFF
jgi:hypothetical protein